MAPWLKVSYIKRLIEDSIPVVLGTRRRSLEIRLAAYGMMPRNKAPRSEKACRVTPEDEPFVCVRTRLECAFKKWPLLA